MLALVFCAQAVAPAPSDTIVVKFAWPSNLRAHVVARRSQYRTAGGRSDTTVSQAEYRMVVQPHARGLLVSYDSLQLPAAGPNDAPDAAALAAAAMPSYVVSADGSFLDLYNVAANIAATRRLLQPVIDSAVRKNPSGRAVFDALLSERFFLQKATEEWNALVGAWAGETFVRDEVYEHETKETIPFPGFENTKVTFNYESSFDGRVPCIEDQPLPECVELTLISYPDPDEIRSILAQLVQRIMQLPSGALSFDSLDIVNTISLIADPATLRPYSLEIVREVSGTVREKNGAAQPVDQTQERVIQFSYAPRREPQPFAVGRDIFRAAAGTWGWARGPHTCEGNPHTISFTAARDTMVLAFRDREEGDSTDDNRVFRYAIRGSTPSSIRGFLIGEDRRTEAGELVVWDLVFMSPDSYRWHRTDWEPTDYAMPIVRCLKSPASRTR